MLKIKQQFNNKNGKLIFNEKLPIIVEDTINYLEKNGLFFYKIKK